MIVQNLLIILLGVLSVTLAILLWLVKRRENLYEDTDTAEI